VYAKLFVENWWKIVFPLIAVNVCEAENCFGMKLVRNKHKLSDPFVFVDVTCAVRKEATSTTRKTEKRKNDELLKGRGRC
jgi:hypothetical protein